MARSLPAGAFGITKEYRQRWGDDAFRALSTVAFKEADADASGYLDMRELRTTLAKVRVRLTEDEAAEIIEHYDIDGNGRLSEEEWHGLLGDLIDGTFAFGATTSHQAPSDGMSQDGSEAANAPLAAALARAAAAEAKVEALQAKVAELEAMVEEHRKRARDERTAAPPSARPPPSPVPPSPENIVADEAAASELKHEPERPVGKRSRRMDAVPATASLEEANTACRAAVASVVAGFTSTDGADDVDGKFTDPMWSVASEADVCKVLYVDGEKPAADCTVQVPNSWRRLSELCDAPVLISDRIRASDVSQGGVGDCFLLGAIASVASHRRELLRNLFVSYDIARGVYGVRLFINGTWSYVLIDDFVGVDEDNDKCFAGRDAKGDDANELWLPLLEKAVAKACCCWENIDGGSASWAVELLTGGLADPRDAIEVSAVEPMDCWTRVAALLKRGDVLTCGTFSDEHYREHGFEYGEGEGTAGEGILACGLIGGHAYSLLGVAEYEGAKLYRIRNPWGAGEWRGAWSDNSAEMTDAARQALGVQQVDDGVFHMAADDFSRHWEEVYSVRLWDASWALTSTSGYFFRGTKLAVAVAAHAPSDGADELGLAEGDVVVLTDMQSNTWWRGYLQPEGGKAPAGEEAGEWVSQRFPKEKVRLEGSTALRQFSLSACDEGTEAVVVLLQPDLQMRRSYTHDREQECNVKVSNYSNVNLTVYGAAGENGEEAAVLATDHGEKRKALVNVQLGPTPLTVSIADYGGAGQKYQLLVYSRSPATITPISGGSGGGGSEDQARAAFSAYDVDGNGSLSRKEIARVLRELDLLHGRDAEEQRKEVDAQFEKVGEAGGGVTIDDFLEWYRALQKKEAGEE